MVHEIRQLLAGYYPKITNKCIESANIVCICIEAVQTVCIAKDRWYCLPSFPQE